ncbi:hypothetical protein RchiOBHm_Chr1g0317091 [Rosa chinensis]|uniref:Uncharacterized protein n=1 Tax=Rosa chinensis TaxID=74649 RepID=A0A2P6S7X0_ROSCH|nr:hypothetical protein RchiOBHm_Chr1g0317091 [Rosa chinensis]
MQSTVFHFIYSAVVLFIHKVRNRKLNYSKLHLGIEIPKLESILKQTRVSTQNEVFQDRVCLQLCLLICCSPWCSCYFLVWGWSLLISLLAFVVLNFMVTFCFQAY